jgi:hypothetical protein
MQFENSLKLCNGYCGIPQQFCSKKLSFGADMNCHYEKFLYIDA